MPTCRRLIHNRLFLRSRDPGKWRGILLRGAPPEPHQRMLNPLGLEVEFTSAAYAAAAISGAALSFATLMWPDNGGTMPGTNRTFSRLSSLFRPQGCRQTRLRAGRHVWWSRRVLPPGPVRVVSATFSTITRCDRAPQDMRHARPEFKVRVGARGRRRDAMGARGTVVPSHLKGEGSSRTSGTCLQLSCRRRPRRSPRSWCAPRRARVGSP